MRKFSNLPWLGVMGLLAACSSSGNDAAAGSSAGGSASVASAGTAASAAGSAGSSSSGGMYDADMSSGGASAGTASGGSSASAGAAGSSANPDPNAGATVVIGATGSVSAIVASSLTLTPAFSPSITDYYVRCATGDNSFSLAVTDDSGTNSTSLDLQENQAAVVGSAYWIRCLPHDFPPITVTKKGATTPGYYLVNSLYYGAVMDVNGVPVWYEAGASTVNVDSPAVNQISMMPNSTAGFGTSLAAEFEIHSLATNTTAIVQAVNTPTDAHELQTLPNGDHLLFTNPIVSGVDLTGLQTYGTNQNIVDCQIQELDPSGNLVWSWNAHEHIDAAKESLEPASSTLNDETVVDVFHCNSIEPDSSGNLLVSSRHTNALFYIDRTSGTIQWKMGGTAYNKDGAALIQVLNDPEIIFSMQHDARFLPNGDITMFDDHGAGTGFARGVEYSIDHTNNTATFVFEFLGSAIAAFEGGFRRYSDGESVIGWGSIPTDGRVVTEVDANGNDVFDIAFDGGDPTYRAVKVPLTQLDLGLMRRAAGQ